MQSYRDRCFNSDRHQLRGICNMYQQEDSTSQSIAKFSSSFQIFFIGQDTETLQMYFTILQAKMECKEKLETEFLKLFHGGQSHLNTLPAQQCDSDSTALWSKKSTAENYFFEALTENQTLHYQKQFKQTLRNTFFSVYIQCYKYILLCMVKTRQLLGKEIRIQRLIDYIHPEWTSQGLQLNFLLEIG